jgi:hypothetical protein
MAIGDSYIDHDNYTWEESDRDGGEIDYLADLVVEGNVGIGTTDPRYKTVIYQAPDDGYDIYGTNARFHMAIGVPGSRALYIGQDTAENMVVFGHHAGSGGFSWFSHNGSAWGERMRIHANGNVGIGTTSPELALTVRSPGSLYGAALFKNASYSHVFSILPHSGVTYLSAGIYYNNGWVHSNDNAANQLFALNPGSGARWYASNNSSGSWNVASNAQLWTDAGVWVGSSSRTLKENFIQLNPDDLLNKINQLDITRWNFKSEGKKITHIGPVAEDFYRIFKTGDAENHLATIDTAGVSLAGVKALYGKVESQQKQIDALKQKVTILETKINPEEKT